MASKHLDIPLVVIAGPTASGKSMLATEIAKHFNGEIICADSRTVYKEMDIATAKPTYTERQGVPHFGLDLVSPNESFSVVEFKKYADKKIDDIKKRGHVPILVGGTGLYLDAVVFNYSFGNVGNKKLRLELQHKSIDELHRYCKEHKINLPENDKNKRYIIRAIENHDSMTSKSDMPYYKSIIVGITTEKNILHERILLRIEQQLKNGVVEEAKLLGKKYGWDSEPMKANMYPLMRKFIQGEVSMAELKAKISTADWRLAKRQMTWLRRNKCIQWMSLDEANTYLSNQLARYK